MRLNEFIYKINKPILFKQILTDSAASTWTPESLAALINDEKLNFRIGKRFNSKLQFENECSYVSGTVREFLDWIGHDKKPESKICRLQEKLNPFGEHDPNECWAYADYKHMNDLVSEKNVLDQNCINWKCFGFENRNAVHSTLWLGTKEAYTPCHYDSYGYNFIAQIYGKKRWTLFSNEENEKMYGTRILFEESTVYSKINLKAPNLDKYPLFCKSKPFVIELEPGDVLYVPHHWWHFVECIDLTISINTWVELEKKDDLMRLKEVLSKTLIQSLMDCNFINFEKWLNSSEKYNSQEENYEDLKTCLLKLNEKNKSSESDDKNEENLKKLVESHPNFFNYINEMSFDEYILKYTKSVSAKQSDSDDGENEEEDDLRLTKFLAKAITNDKIIDLITEKFLDEFSE